MNEVNLHYVYNIPIHNQHVYALTVLSNGYLASCSQDRSINIINVNESSFSVIITIKNNQNEEITYICELASNKIISSSKRSVVIWLLDYENKQVSTLSILTIDTYYTSLYKVITLRYNRIAAFVNRTFVVWESIDPYKQLIQLNMNGSLSTIHQLKNHDILVLTDYNNQHISFMDLKTYQICAVFTDIYCVYRNSICEMENDLLCIGGMLQLTFINVNLYIIDAVIKFDKDVFDQKYLCFFALVQNERGNILVGDGNGNIREVDYEKKTEHAVLNKAHSSGLLSIVKLKPNLYASSGGDAKINIWKSN